jgi:hypothetical protein
MLTEYEARKLQHEMRHELEGPTDVVWKCALGLVVLALVAILGSIATIDPSSDDLAKQQTGKTAERRL